MRSHFRAPAASASLFDENACNYFIVLSHSLHTPIITTHLILNNILNNIGQQHRSIDSNIEFLVALAIRVNKHILLHRILLAVHFIIIISCSSS